MKNRVVMGALALGLVAIVAAGVTSAAASPGKSRDAEASFALPNTSGTGPPGSNDFSCEGRRGKRTPVILVHGTYASMGIWNFFSSALARGGWCVFALDLPDAGLARMQRSVRVLSSFVDRVRRATGRQRVSIIGHSQGGLLPRLYVKRYGGEDKVRDVIGLAPPNHGVPDLIEAPGVPCWSCRQFMRGSVFLRRLNRGTEIPGRRVDYTVVASTHEEFVTPYASAFLLGAGDRLTNVTLQNRCLADSSTHFQIPDDRVALQWARNALNRPGPANPRFEPAC